MNLIITKHAYERGKERMGLAAGAFKKIAAQAYCYGVGMEETKGALNKHLQELATQKARHLPRDIQRTCICIFQQPAYHSVPCKA